jgi:four helix bundle protein
MLSVVRENWLFSPDFGHSGSPSTVNSQQARRRSTVLATGLHTSFGMLKNFRAYQLSIEYYHKCEELKCAKHLREQLGRASSSISLNLAEGSCQPTMANRSKYYHIAFGSLGETQTIVDLAKIDLESPLFKMADELGAQIYKLCLHQKKNLSKAR